MTKIITVSNRKGGVAKTTTVHSLGDAFTELGKSVLLVDLDPQANLTVGLGLNAQDIEVSIANVLLDASLSLEDIVEATETLRMNAPLACAGFSERRWSTNATRFATRSSTDNPENVRPASDNCAR
mgnify:CR=1 FL=1